MQPATRPINSDDNIPSQQGKSLALLPSDYNFILFFSLPFYPVCKTYRRTISFHGHLSLGLGGNVYQLHDPRKLRSKFLVSKMPITSWLFEDGRWYEWDPSSEFFRHVHLYERAEVKRTVVFYAALKDFPLSKQTLYENYFEKLESDFQKGLYHFSLLHNNCSRAINNVFYREKWIQWGPLDFLPSVSFKRLVASWNKKGGEFITGYIDKNRLSTFKLHKLCLGMVSLAPEKMLIRWLDTIGHTV
jgi:hypothetical protein